MKVVQVKKEHLKRIFGLIVICSFFLSFYLHYSAENPTRRSKKAKHEKGKSKAHKDTDNPKDKISEEVHNIPFEEIRLSDVNQDENMYKSDDLAYAESEVNNEKDDVTHVIDDSVLPFLVNDFAPASNVDLAIEKLVLDDIKQSDVSGYPKLVEGVGNYENYPRMPEVGAPGYGGVGEGGLDPIVLNKEEEKGVEGALNLWGFNMVASNKVSLDRVPADLRMEECKNWDYPERLPAASIILVFHNEGFTTLMRTVHSVINYSPPELINEVVMVDDGSTREYIKNGTIDKYISRFNGLVKLYHNDRREGLIRARTIGGKHAVSSVLIYLDAHCEVEQNWLPPLITPIAQDYRICTVPMVDSIDGNTYVFEPQQGGDENNLARGAWDWNFDWKRIPLNDREKALRKTVSEPFRSPAMAGGLFAISAKWFKELGFYDDKLEIWGGENFELSYKLWMCGGQLLFVPCSRVGHIYRMKGWSGSGTPDRLKGTNFIAVNYNRVIETWWDSYKKYYYERRPENKDVDPGDLTYVRSIREKLQCKSFEWYMTEIAYDIPKYWPFIQPKMVATGILMNLGTGLCARQSTLMNNGDPIKMGACLDSDVFTLSWHEDIAPGDGARPHNHCWDTEMETDGIKSLVYWECHRGYGNQLYKYLPQSKHIWSPGQHMCVTSKDNLLFFARCSDTDPNQQWEWQTVNADVIERVNKVLNRQGESPPELDYVV